MKSMSLSDIPILKIRNSENRCIITGISKSEAIRLLKNIDFTKRSETL